MLTLNMLNSLKETLKCTCIFIVISWYWDGRNSSLWKTTICLSCIINTMAADDLSIQGARASLAMLWTLFSGNAPYSAPEGVNYTSHFNGIERGYTGFTLSICPSVDIIMSAPYLQQYSSNPFHICTFYQATSEGMLLVKFVLNQNI